jgi:prolyl oligopeptidase
MQPDPTRSSERLPMKRTERLLLKPTERLSLKRTERLPLKRMERPSMTLIERLALKRIKPVLSKRSEQPLPSRHAAATASRPLQQSLLATALALALLRSSAALGAPPPTPKQPVVETLQGVTVRDDYRWLEEDSTGTRAWSDAQDAAARKALAALPGLPVLRQRIAGILQQRQITFRPFALAGGRLLAIERDPQKQQPMLVSLALSADPASARLLLDPNALDPSGHTTLDWAVPSPDGGLLAASLSKGGSESGDLHLYETATGREVEPSIAGVQGGTAGGSVAWAADGKGFWYTRYPRKGERPEAEHAFWQQVWFHALGTQEQDDRPQLEQLGRIAEVELRLDDSEPGTGGSGAVLADVRNGDGGEHAFWLRQPGAGWSQVTRNEDGIVAAAFGKGALYLLSRKGTPRGEVLRLPFGAALSQAARLVAQGEGSIEEVLVTAGRVLVREIRGGPERVRVFDLGGQELSPLPTPEVASISFGPRLSGDGVLLEAETYLKPPAWFLLDASSGALAETPLRQKAAADFSAFEAVRETCRSRDGTAVPLTVIRKKGLALDGKSPTLLQAYGGYNLSLTPGYRPVRITFLEQGGVLAIANLRGGGEFGEEWHDQGRLTRKQNVFDDFLACAEHLVAAGYTRPERLAIEGGSNGGLLMGAALTQRPHLFRAVVSHVGIYDMLRTELSPNGAFNVTEYGTVQDKAQFDALYGYSPYHHVVDGVRYPAVLMMTGANDPRVEPMQSRKMAARLQAASASGLPVLLRVDKNSGHGIGASRDEQIERAALVDAFLFDQLGVKVKAALVAPPPR